MTDRLEQLQHLHAADPDDADLPYMIALELGKQDQFDDAIAWLDKAIATNPHHHYAYFQKAKMQSELGEDADAIDTLTQGIAQAQQAGDAKALGELTELRTMINTGE